MKLDVKVRTAAEVLVDQLILHGVTHIFCVPGESYLGVLDACHDRDITLTVCRHEGGAAMMADAVGKATGRPGVCFVTRGPGAANAAAGVHIAHQDSTPMIMFVGQVDRGVREREAWQELDVKAVFGSMTKWTAELDDPARVPEYVARAFHTATSGRPGPVVIALPHDMLGEPVNVADAPPFTPVETSPGEPEMEALQALLHEARAPFFIVGGSRWDAPARAAMQAFAERFEVPVATGYRRLPLFDALHPSYAGDLGLGANPMLVARVKAADLVVVVGARLSEVTSQTYSLFEIPGPKTRLVHVHPGAEELGRIWTPHLAIHATQTRFVAALARLPAPAHPRWSGAAEAAHADYLAW